MMDSQMAYLTKMNLNRILQNLFKSMLQSGEFTYWIQTKDHKITQRPKKGKKKSGKKNKGKGKKRNN